MVTENFFRGWSAPVAGHPTAVGRADYTLIGVPLSAGATTVDLEFHSRADSVGLMVTFAAATLALLWLAAVAVLDRRRHG
jgi:uncharacterized membrane protein YfhO